MATIDSRRKALETLIETAKSRIEIIDDMLLEPSLDPTLDKDLETEQAELRTAIQEIEHGPRIARDTVTFSRDINKVLGIQLSLMEIHDWLRNCPAFVDITKYPSGVDYLKREQGVLCVFGETGAFPIIRITLPVKRK